MATTTITLELEAQPTTGRTSRIVVTGTGNAGPAGANGAGVAVGGTTGQVLVKASATDYDTAWSSATVIAETTLSGNTPSVTFSSIPTTWRRLTLSFSLRTDRAAAEDYVLMSINGNTNNHVRQGFEQFNASVGNFTSGSNTRVALVHGGTATAGLQGEAVVIFANSHTSDARKSWVQFYVRSAASLFNTGYVWSSLAEANPITSITLAPALGSNFTAGHAILTGVR